ncbi:MAG: adenylate/guanylate cyclase domain-containing protein [Spirochaetaceae bacterium]|nr:MAG: adenylate/guanylate cyclase domain-containing protein [Spirochaetaceae bacterium]
MKVRWKIVSVVLPLLIVTIVLVGVSAVLSSTTGITRLAQEFLDFKARELQKHGESQWRLLVENQFTERPDMISAMQGGVLAYAGSLLSTDTELVLAVDQTGTVQASTGEITLSAAEQEQLARLHESRDTTLQTFTLGGVERVIKGFYFAPFDWFFLFTETRDTFYRDIDRIIRESAIILSVALLVSLAFLLVFSSQLTRPMAAISGSMRKIIESSDLTERVGIDYNDETGQMAHTFNIMLGELERAYTQIKKFAFQAVLAQKKEAKIRNIFQKYVPQDLIDRFFANPESMLVGENRELSILFSDIRSFTTISESMRPDDLVSSLNRYFSVMVDIIMSKQGIIDKYIGDAIMAFFGAPVKHDGDAFNSVMAGIEMTEAVKDFNHKQVESGRPEFKIGVGIAYGEVTVGNIGTEKKMDYTVIGDIVNLASRLEGLTKQYQQELIIGESLFPVVKSELPWRLLDTVAVKGRAGGVRIYTVTRRLNKVDGRAWEKHNEAMEAMYSRDFAGAAEGFGDVLSLVPNDPMAKMMQERNQRYLVEPPPADWNGVEVMKSK